MTREPLDKIIILYASQTGTAEDVASSIGRTALERGFPRVLVSSLDDYDDWLGLVEEKIVIFVVATTGDGDEPDNMKEFWRFLLSKRLTDSKPLDGLLFGIFGLGDSSYAKFNYTGKRLFRRLQQLGASPVVPRGDGDDQHPQGLYGALAPWLVDLWFNVYRHFECSHLKPLTSLLRPKYDLIPLTPHTTSTCNQSPSFTFELLENQRLTGPNHFQDVRHVVIKPEIDTTTSQSDDQIKPGDIVQINARCLEEDVDSLISMMGWSGISETLFCIKKDRPDASEDIDGKIMTFRHILVDLVDIWSPPQRSFVEWLGKLMKHQSTLDFSKEHLERHQAQLEKLQEYVSSPDGYEDWTSYCIRLKRTIPEILRDFDLVRIPYQYVFDVFPRNRARSFSISNSYIKDEKRIMELTIAIVDYQTRIKARRQGFFTRWLKGLNPGRYSVGFSVKPGTMNIPFDRPVILVAAGTGIAPFRYFLHERKRRYETDLQFQGMTEPETWLFYGFRDESQDAHYLSEFTKMFQVEEETTKSGGFHLVLAPSRTCNRKIYVQTRMVEPEISPHLHRMLFQLKSSVFIAGNTKLPDAVMTALATILNRHEPNVHHPNVLSAWKQEGRIQWESW